MIISLLSGIIRNARNRKAAREASAEAQYALDQQQSQLDSYFMHDYYGDYLNRSDVQAMMRSMQDQMRQQNTMNYNMSAITGATPEATAARQNNSAALLGNTYNQMASNVSNWRSNVLNNYINNSMALTNQDYSRWAQQAANFYNSAHQSMSQALDSYTQMVTAAIGAIPAMV